VILYTDRRIPAPQKLHKRFSAKGTQTSRSSKNLVLDPSKSAGTASPVVEAQQHFPGHQEFFFIFILSTDCYSFGIHLRNRLKSEILKLLSSSDTIKGVEKRLLQLKLLSRFLGLLIFSPSWHDSGVVGGTHYDRLSEFNPDLDVVGMVERAYKERYLVITIPWVVEFLRMARWSPLQKSDDFKRLLALLLGIHHRIRCDANEASGNLGANMQLVSLYFETLFGDIIGLERAATIPGARVDLTSVPANVQESRQPDECSLGLSNSLFCTSSPHAEELVALLSSQAQTKTRPSSSSRKLTPYSVGGSLGSSADPLGISSSTSLSPMKSKNRRGIALGSGTEEPFEAGDSLILAKLVEAFFHQHGDLKDICEFVVDQALKNASTRVRDDCVIPTLEQKMSISANANSDVNLLREAEEQVVEASCSCLAAELERTIPEALTTLLPPSVQPRVRDVATKLSISHATHLGYTTMDALVRLESKKLSLKTGRKSNKQATSPEASDKMDTGDQHRDDERENALISLRNALANRMWERGPDNMLAVVASAKEVLPSRTKEDAAPPRGLHRAFELSSVPFLQWALQDGSPDGSIRWKMAADFLGLVTAIITKSKSRSQECFVTKISSYLSFEESIDTLIELCPKKGDNAKDIQTICDLLLDLTRTKLIPWAQLEVALIRWLQNQDDGRILCHNFLQRVDMAEDGQRLYAFTKLRDDLKLARQEE